MSSLAVSGCGPSTYKISGKVTYQGKPVTYGILIFYYMDGSRNDARIYNDGSYSILDAKAGHVHIAVESPKPRVPAGQEGVNGQPDPAKWFPIDKKYTNPDTSGKEADIKGVATIDITLD
jgi:hypothetical protein